MTHSKNGGRRNNESLKTKYEVTSENVYHSLPTQEDLYSTNPGSHMHVLVSMLQVPLFISWQSLSALHSKNRAIR